LNPKTKNTQNPFDTARPTQLHELLTSLLHAEGFEQERQEVSAFFACTLVAHCHLRDMHNQMFTALDVLKCHKKEYFSALLRDSRLYDKHRLLLEDYIRQILSTQDVVPDTISTRKAISLITEVCELLNESNYGEVFKKPPADIELKLVTQLNP
jgi:hypothetical protein